VFFDEPRFKPAVLRTLPALAVTGMVAWFTALMTPATYVTGAFSPYAYRITQPAVLFGYFRKFFLPLGLSADSDRHMLNGLFQEEAIYGFLFLLALAALTVWCCKRRELRPVAFGLVWFLVTSLPTSLIALAEVENDHRMYLPFVGLSLAVCQAGALLAGRRRIPTKAVGAVCALVLAGFAWGARERNEVWNNDETLWHDVTVKSPNNGRGLMNYGLTQMEKGRYAEALSYFQRALVFNPNYYILEINLGIANGATGNAAEAERHFLRAIQLAPAEASARYFYARWLAGVNRNGEALGQLQIAERQNPDYVSARYLLMQIYSTTGDAASLRREAQETLARFPSDTAAAAWLSRSANLPPAPPAPARPTADDYVALSLNWYRAGKYQECIAAAREALRIRPDYAEAWNNIGAAYNSMSQWDEGIAAAKEAIRLKPDFEVARNNLAWAEGEKRKQAGSPAPRQN
jgi:tetratricopeptide (TPR) repeat protein